MRILSWATSFFTRVWRWLFPGDQGAALEAGEIALRVILGIAALLVLVQTVRFVAARVRRGRGRRASSTDAAARTQTAAEWEVLARSAAEDGRWRDAALFLYQAVLHRLAERDRVRLHPAKTPRDYRREIRQDAQLLDRWVTFVGRFEPLAFGPGAPDPDAYERLRSAAEPLGTRG